MVLHASESRIRQQAKPVVSCLAKLGMSTAECTVLSFFKPPAHRLLPSKVAAICETDVKTGTHFGGKVDVVHFAWSWLGPRQNDDQGRFEVASKLSEHSFERFASQSLVSSAAGGRQCSQALRN